MAAVRTSGVEEKLKIQSWNCMWSQIFENSNFCWDIFCNI